MTMPVSIGAGSRRQKPAPVEEPYSASSGELDIVLIRSARRTKTVSSRLRNWYTLEVRAPVKIDDDELRRIIDELVARTVAKRGKHRKFSSDKDLEERARKLNRRHFGGQLKWVSIRYVTNQNTRFGSCTPIRGTIRISHRLAGVPTFVLEYVIVHEMAHLLESNHSKAFWDLVYRFPKTERARGYLMALGMEEDLVAAEDRGDGGVKEP